MDTQLALTNLSKFDHVIVAEDGMDSLNELGWIKESDTTHPTFGDKKRAAILFLKLRWFRLFYYLKNKKFTPPSEMNIAELNTSDLTIYNSFKK